MEYRLNSTPVRTSNNYGINDILLDLDMKEYKEFSKFKIDGIDYKEYDRDMFTSRIGLSFNRCHRLDIKVEKDSNVKIIYDDNKDLIDEIFIELNENTDSNIIIKYASKNDIFHHLKLIINGRKNSHSNISIINLLSNNSKSFIATEKYLDYNANVEVNFIDLSGNIRVSNYYVKLSNEKSISKLNNIFMGNDNDLIDMNYYVILNSKKTEGYINAQGSLNGYSHKSFKGTIDFLEGSSKSIGKEYENTVLLSDNVKSKSLPMLLCHEEDVIGAHGVSSGKINPEKLFYVMSRGIDEEAAKKLIIKSNFNEIISKINDDNIKDEVINFIDKNI